MVMSLTLTFPSFSTPLLRVLRPFAFAVVFLLAAATFVGATPKHPIASYNFGAPNANCYHLFLKGWETDNAKGTYRCFAREMSEGLFSANDWNGDPDIQTWMDAQYGTDADGYRHYVVITEYSGNPVRRCEPGGGSQCAVDAGGNVVMRTAYLIFVQPYTCNPPTFDGEHPSVVCAKNASVLGASGASFTILVEPDSTLVVE